MKDEIKEILEFLNIPMNESWACSLEDYQAHLLLDYITNLQDTLNKIMASDGLTTTPVLDLINKNKKLQDRNIELVLERDRLKELCDKYEEEHSTTFEEWKKDINIIDELEKELDKGYRDLFDMELVPGRELISNIKNYLKELKEGKE